MRDIKRMYETSSKIYMYEASRHNFIFYCVQYSYIQDYSRSVLS